MFESVRTMTDRLYRGELHDGFVDFLGGLVLHAEDRVARRCLTAADSAADVMDESADAWAWCE